MRCQQHIVEAQKSRVDLRLLFEDIEARAANALVAKGIDESIFVDHGTAGGVDEQRGRFHSGKRGGVDEVVGIGRERAVQRDHITGLQQLVERHSTGSRVVHDLHPEGLGPLGHSASDAAHPHNAQPRPVELKAAQQGGMPAIEAALTDSLVALSQTPTDPKQQGQSKVGRGRGEHAGGVGDDDASFAGSVEVDVVDPHGMLGDDLELRDVHQVGIHRVGEHRQQTVTAPHAKAQNHLRDGRVAVDQIDAETGTHQDSDAGRVDVLSDKHAHLRPPRRSYPVGPRGVAWDTARANALDTAPIKVTMSHDVDVLIIGLGTAGAAAARACARQGLRVVGIDARPLHDAGARWLNGVPTWTFDEADVPRPTGKELAGEGHAFHMVAGWGPGKITVPSAELLEVDMRLLVERLQADALTAGARLKGEEKARAWELLPKPEGGAVVRTSHGTYATRVVVDASGLKGVPFAPPPAVPREELCVAAQEVRDVADLAAARAFFEGHGVPPGDTLCFTSVTGGYSIVNVRLDEALGVVNILTGAIPGAGHKSGPDLIRAFANRHAWLGATRFGGSRAIPLMPPLARLDNGPLMRIGDSARQVFAAHGSGIGAQLLAAHLLAEVLAGGGTPWDYTRKWQKRWGGHFCGSVAFARFSRALEPEALRELFASGLLAPAATGRTLAQRRMGLGPADLPDLPRMLAGAFRSPRWLSKLAPVASAVARLELHHTRFPRSPSGVPAWKIHRDTLLDSIVSQ